MLRSSLYDYTDAYILASSTITVPQASADGAAVSKAIEKNIIIKNCALFTNCISEINNTQIDNAKDMDIVMAMYNLIEYSDNYSKTSGSLWYQYRDEPFLGANGAVADFPANDNNSV